MSLLATRHAIHGTIAIIAAALVGCWSEAGAQPAAPSAAPRPPAATCKPSNKVLFQVDHHDRALDPVLRSQLVLETSGAWTLFDTTGGSQKRRASGCLTPANLRVVTEAVATATWKAARTGAMCDAYSTQFTEYRIGKKLVLTRELCDGIVLDDKTARSMKRIGPILGALDKPATPR